jgi:hypothetical protein
MHKIEKKDFFFEKKKQKTFALAPSSPDVDLLSLRGAERTKVLWFFFQKGLLCFFQA